MKKALKQQKYKLFHIVDSEIIDGQNRDMTGDCTGLSGNCSELSGDCSGLSGDLDACEISTKNRVDGIDISDLIK